ncbi:helix-turn-helix domain-containing protein [Actinomadura harenae]|uniref:helix-turn-helix domain-containing protein n=1 Tax=Actinomadura harenae TaxID=2483351 RepID=UPI0013159E77|nr:helix-turn-helix transcriptional regulator [Actinomadura harenae]
MDPRDPVWATPTLREAIAHQQYGRVVRILRQAEGLTLAELGRRCGYSGSRLSRLERDHAPLTDVGLLRTFATALHVSPAVFGLLPASEEPADAGKDIRRPSGPTVVPGTAEAEEDPVRRRELLAVSASMAGAAALGLPRRASAATPGSLDRILFSGVTSGEPVSLATLRDSVELARTKFEAAQYGELGQALPHLLAAATATRDHANIGDLAQANGLLADAYLTTAALMIKRSDDLASWTAADRAFQAAMISGDPLAVADARRAQAVVLRRTGRRTQARDMVLDAARSIEPDGHASDEQLSVYGNLLQVAAYTAAVDEQRHTAHEYIGEAARIARRLGHDANLRHTAFGPSNVTGYQVSIAQVLGDSGAAIEHARALQGVPLPTRERRGRLGVDVASAYHQWGRMEDCYRTLRSVERVAPDEVRYRPPVRRMVQDLLRADRGSLPGLRAFAGRVGVRA